MLFRSEEGVTQAVFAVPKPGFVPHEDHPSALPDDEDVMLGLELVLHLIAEVDGPGCRTLDTDLGLVVGRIDTGSRVYLSESILLHSAPFDRKEKRHVAVTYGYYCIFSGCQWGTKSRNNPQ